MNECHKPCGGKTNGWCQKSRQWFFFLTVGNERGPGSFRGAAHVLIYDVELVSWDGSLGEN